MEAIIVCTLLITVMVSGLFLHRVYAAKYQVLREARTVAWTQAMAGCNSQLSLLAIIRTVGPLHAPLPMDMSAPPSFFADISHTTGKPGVAAANVEVVSHARLGGGSFSFNAEQQLACNEIIQSENGDMIDVMSYGIQHFLPSMFSFGGGGN